jgi:hypothetical protein
LSRRISILKRRMRTVESIVTMLKKTRRKRKIMEKNLKKGSSQP